MVSGRGSAAAEVNAADGDDWFEAALTAEERYAEVERELRGKLKAKKILSPRGNRFFLKIICLLGCIPPNKIPK